VVREVFASDVETDAAVLGALRPEELSGLQRGLAGVLRVLRAADGTQPDSEPDPPPVTAP
jgi:hypothetical protein